jgi:hypothetical protein
VKRGDLVLVAMPGDYGKPRPALVLQNGSLGPRLDFSRGPFITGFWECSSKSAAHAVHDMIGVSERPFPACVNV